MPVAATVAFRMEGFANALVNPFGPVHAKLATPGELVEAERDNVFPEQIGALLPTTGDAGAEGSVSVKGPTSFDGQPASVTKICSYKPAERPVITKTPAAFDDRVSVTGNPPFFV